jgi:hypothetical protein
MFDVLGLNDAAAPLQRTQHCAPAERARHEALGIEHLSWPRATP